MSWRTVVISGRCKLDLKMGYMVVRAEETRRIYLDEIAVLMIENPAVSMTCALLSALTEKKIKVIFCDAEHSPQAEIVPYYGCHDSSRKINMQLSWHENIKGAVWGVIIADKIRKQADMLAKHGRLAAAELVYSYIDQLEFQDASNREGHAAKVYFNALFGKEFSRSADSPINSALNYGYTVMLSAFNREIAANGYITQLGLHHGNVFNRFNLSSDLMEPFRILVDAEVYALKPQELNKDTKRPLYALLNNLIFIDGTKQTVLNAISIYCKSVFDALNKADPELVKLPAYEL